MNIKAYLRGIGAGMIVTALIMGVPQAPKESHSEPIDKSRLISSTIPVASASQDTETTTSSVKTSDKDTTSAGASAETSVTTSTGTSASKEGKEDKETAASTSTSTSTSTGTSASKETETSASTGTSTGTSTGASTETPETSTSTSTSTSVSTINPLPEGETGYTNKEGSVEIKVIKGDSSVSVSRRMFEAGLVESAVEFDKYLCANGYDHSISVGTYEIEYGLDFETMAKIITRRK